MTKRAILSPFDKTGLIELAKALLDAGYELIASGGTSKALIAAGLPVSTVESLTKFPEMLGGRVKTLHPAIHGGILADRSQAHKDELAKLELGEIDLVVCNLYPFVETVAKPDITELEAIEQIDIGGVTLLRAAAKNFAHVSVLCDPSDYAAFIASLGTGGANLDARRAYALKAYRHTAGYDAAISEWLGARVQSANVESFDELPANFSIGVERVQELRYGENPHQAAGVYSLHGKPLPYEMLGGKELSYNNLLDLDAAWGAATEFETPSVAIIKHSNPCGLATDDDLIRAFNLALESDPVSAFGSIIAVNRKIDVAFVEALGKLFVEVLAAPSFDADAVELIAKKKKNCRIVRCTPGHEDAISVRAIRGAMLVQSPDLGTPELSGLRIVSDKQPSDDDLDSLKFAWRVAKHVKSNAIVMVQGQATVGVGAGQMNRLNSVKLAAEQAGEKAKNAVLASDAFFPFADGIEAAAAAGVRAVIQPGGSMRDDEVIAAANKLGLVMVFTGTRHFKH